MKFQRLQSLRHRVWSGDIQQVVSELGEALRDLHGFVSRLCLFDVIEVRSVVWAEPFSLGVDLAPRIVLLADARIAGSLSGVATGALDWQIELGTGGHRAKINRAVNLTPGQQYDLKFLVVF